MKLKKLTLQLVKEFLFFSLCGLTGCVFYHIVTHTPQIYVVHIHHHAPPVFADPPAPNDPGIFDL